MPIAPLVAQNKEILVISPSVGLKDFNETADNIFNTWPHDEKATRALARYARNKNWKTAAIFGSQDPWVKTQSDVFAEEFMQLGGSISIRVEPIPTSRDLKTEALKIRNSKPDVVFFSNYQADVFARNLKELNAELPKLSILMERERVKAANGALEGTVFAQYEEPAIGFKEAFRKKFATEPGITADSAFDAVMLYAKAIVDVGGEEVSAVKDRLHNIRGYKGASGTFSFDATGAVDKNPVLWRVAGLDYVRVAD
jgi:branched-chain amino acid transport system substrate-binding protein